MCTRSHALNTVYHKPLPGRLVPTHTHTHTNTQTHIHTHHTTYTHRTPPHTHTEELTHTHTHTHRQNSTQRLLATNVHSHLSIQTASQPASQPAQQILRPQSESLHTGSIARCGNKGHWVWAWPASTGRSVCLYCVHWVTRLKHRLS